MPASCGLIPGHVLRANLSAPVTVPSILSSDNKASYENSSHPGDPPKEEELVNLCMPTGRIPMIPGQSEGGDSHLSFPTLPRKPALQGWKGPQPASCPALLPGLRCQEGYNLPKPRGMLLDLGHLACVVLKNLSVFDSWLLDFQAQ